MRRVLSGLRQFVCVYYLLFFDGTAFYWGRDAFPFFVEMHQGPVA